MLELKFHSSENPIFIALSKLFGGTQMEAIDCIVQDQCYSYKHEHNREQIQYSNPKSNLKNKQ